MCSITIALTLLAAIQLATGTGQDAFSDLDEHCQEAFTNCRQMHKFYIPRTLVPPNQIDSLCGQLTSFKACYQSGMAMACPLLLPQEMVEKACENKNKYKQHADCYNRIYRNGNNFSDGMKNCETGEASFRRLVRKPFGRLSEREHCQVLRESADCASTAFEVQCRPATLGDFESLRTIELGLRNC